MKRNWQPEQLIEHWTLLPSEFELLNNKTSTNRLAIALLLKYFQYEGRFPTSKAEIPQDAIIYVAQLLKVNPKRLEQYNWQSRTMKHHRAIIREFLGVTEATVEDGDALSQWLETQVLAYDLKFESLKNAAQKRLRYLKIELPTSERLERIIRSAIRAFEQNFCQQIAEQIPTAVCQKLDQLLQTNLSESESESELTENEEIKANNNIYSPLAILKRDPGRLGLDSLISEAEKLKQLRQLELPSHLFQGFRIKYYKFINKELR